MIAVVQRVSEAAVRVNGSVVGEIDAGLIALVAVHRDDSAADVAWMSGKLSSLRIFRNGEKEFDLDVRGSRGDVLLVSNFTVAAQTRSGRRPSFDEAAEAAVGRKWFEALVEAVAATGLRVQTGQFGADMKVALVNDGPATVLLDSRCLRERSDG